MASFDVAFDFSMGHEGMQQRGLGYVHDPLDRGGETLAGIARTFHPSWSGWEVVDRLRTQPDFPNFLSGHAALKQAVREFYREMFWDRMCGDRVASQVIATEMFDTGVNMGLRVPIEFVQRGCNALNRSGDLYPELEVDGQMGPRTLHAVAVLTERREDDVLHVVMNCLQGARYVAITETNGTQDRFTRGWFKRVSLNVRPPWAA